MSELIFGSNNICLAAVGHDPDGRWVDLLSESDPLLTNLYSGRLISLTDRTHNSTIDTALALGWRVKVENLPVGSARFAVVKRGLETDCSFINLWDGDRLLHAVKRAPEELQDITERIPKYDCFIAGATPEAIATHQLSMTVWEGVKSWALGGYIGIRGDIATRGCFGFSQEFARFLVQHELSTGYDTDALFAVLPLAFRKSVTTGRETIGYAEYGMATAYEDGEFEGLSPEESAAAKNTHADFIRRAESVLKAIILAEGIGQEYGLGFPPDGAGMKDMIKHLAQQI